MGESMKKILVIASVALNVVFIATYLACKAPSLAGGRPSPAPGGPPYLQLDLAPDQLKQFAELRGKSHARFQALGGEIKTRQIELIDLLGSTPLDQEAVKSKKEEIQRLQGEVQDRVIDHFRQASAYLNPEQRARFLGLIKARIETNVQACPPWMKPSEKGRPEDCGNE